MQTCEIQGLFKLGANKKSSDPRRLVFATPSYSMKRENYIHVDGYCRQKPNSKGLFWQFQLFAGPQSSAAILCLALKASGVGPKVAAMTFAPRAFSKEAGPLKVVRPARIPATAVVAADAI